MHSNVTVLRRRGRRLLHGVTDHILFLNAGRQNRPFA
jgi:hypothetical protein